MPTFGPTEDQKRVSGNEALALPRGVITRVMQGRFAQRKDYGSIGRQATEDLHRAERERTIRRLGLEPGKTILVKRTRGKKGHIQRLITQITSEDWRVFVEGLKDPIPLSLIVEVLE